MMDIWILDDRGRANMNNYDGPQSPKHKTCKGEVFESKYSFTFYDSPISNFFPIKLCGRIIDRFQFFALGFN